MAFENDVARFIRANYGPGEKSVMHRHLPGCVIFLTDQRMNFTIPDGSTEPATVEAGALGCGDGNVHLPENVEVRVWDSTAELRYLVLPERPAATEGMTEDQLAALVTRDSMIGAGMVAGAAEAEARPGARSPVRRDRVRVGGLTQAGV